MFGTVFIALAFLLLASSSEAACSGFWMDECPDYMKSDEGNTWNVPREQDDSRRGYQTSPYNSPGTSLMAEPTYEPWRTPEAGDSLLGDPTKRTKSNAGSSLW